MSQMSVATTVAKRSTSGARRPSLRVVIPQERTGSAWFPVLCVALLLAGLAAVLGLNTAMAQDSFEVTALEARTAELADTQAALQQSINSHSSPQNLATEARALGMAPSDTAAFIDIEKGQILGVATLAEKPEGFTVDAASTATVEEQTSSKTTSDDGEAKASDEPSDASRTGTD
ncbi:hypothetical protein [Janibacter alittae]|uniref:Cell division protein FtsL n=1 Tax=Janibacter alittae TaxID=3115209 RepID=A0ABZ2MKP3_9MICO